MKVKFDSLNRFEVPDFLLCNPGCVYKDGTLTNVIGCLSNTTDEELIMNFNTTSELNFRIYLVDREDPDERAYVKNIYNSIKNRRLIFIEDIGFFVITNVKVGYDSGVHYKDVQAESCEYELGNRVMPYIEDGTYKVDVTRVDSHIYKIDGTSYYIKMPYCYEYSYSDEAILKVKTFYGRKTGTLIWIED